MKITRNNYEVYFIDYLDGKLDNLLVDDFIEFLQQNPDLKEELTLFKPFSVPSEKVVFEKKEELYKQKYDQENVFNHAAIGSLEGDLTSEEKEDFENYLSKHPEKKNDIKLFNKTILKPDENIVFTKKRKIYRYSLSRKIMLWSGRIAAVLVLGFAFYVLMDKPEQEIVQVDKIAMVDKSNTEKTENPELEKPTLEKGKKVPVQTTKKPVQPPEKTTVPEKKATKSLRETTKGRIKHEDLAMIRMPVFVPAKMNRLDATIHISQTENNLASMHSVAPENRQNFNDERLLADVVKEKTGLDKISFNKITKAGLNLVSNITKDNFHYETDEKGKITEYNFDSRLLAFSIPTRHEIDSE